MDLGEFRTYLLTHFASEVAAGDDGAILAQMQSVADQVPGPIPRETFLIWLGSTGLRAAVEDHSKDTTSPLRASALVILDFLVGGPALMDFANSGNQAMLGAWVSAGALSATQRDELIAVSSRPRTVAERDGYAEIAIEDIRRAIWHDDGTRAI